MLKKKEVLNLIKELENSDLTIEVKEKIQFILKEFSILVKERKVDWLEYNFILTQIFSILVQKIMANNPDFSIDVIEKCVDAYINCEKIKDIVVVNETVFLQEEYVTNKKDIIKRLVNLDNGNNRDGYKEISDISFSENLNKTSLKSLNQETIVNSNFKDIQVFITSSLNKILENLLKEKKIFTNVVTYNDKMNIAYKIDNIKVYLDHNLEQIQNKLLEKVPTTIKMIVLVDKEIHYFEIVQFLKDEKINWVGCKITPKIWKLSDEFKKNEVKRLNKSQI